MFTNEQLNNLAVFLQRADMKGSEVPAYVSIVDVINVEMQNRQAAMQDQVLTGPNETENGPGEEAILLTENS
tara:strand:+ start:7139 stop:7354 length:216 start_codon:yes stop_codon:yes gene_type:complete